MVRIARSLFVLAAVSAAGCDGARSAARLARPDAPAPSAPVPVAAGPVHLLQSQGPGPLRGEGWEGVLRLDAQGCFRLGSDTNPVLVWPRETAVDLTEPGVVRVFDRRSGASVEVGEAVTLGGADATAETVSLGRPAAPCSGALWVVKSFAPAPPAA